MNPTKQFWTLVRFQYVLNPLLWLQPLLAGFLISIPFLIAGRHSNYHMSLSFYFFINQSFFFVGIFGSMILSPEKFQFGRAKTANLFFGTEFLLTRAVDRSIVYRAKAFLLYATFLLLPLGVLIYFADKPALVVSEYSSNETSQLLENIPGSTMLAKTKTWGQPDIIIPHGYLLIAGWQLWTFLLSLMALQFAVATLSPYKWGPRIFWGVVYFSLLAPSLLPFYSIKTGIKEDFSPLEKGFFFFVEHQPGVWICTFLPSYFATSFANGSSSAKSNEAFSF